MISLAELTDLVNNLLYSVTDNFTEIFQWVILTGIVQLANQLMGYRLCVLGVIPRTIPGLVGIPLHPFVHGNWGHWFMNALMFIIMASLVAIQGLDVWYTVSQFIIVASGAAIWLFGRNHIHVGASGLVLGYYGYLLANAWGQPNWLTIVLAGVCLYYFWWMILNLFPSDKSVSWEGHLFGFLSGVGASLYISSVLV